MYEVPVRDIQGKQKKKAPLDMKTPESYVPIVRKDTLPKQIKQKALSSNPTAIQHQISYEEKGPQPETP